MAENASSRENRVKMLFDKVLNDIPQGLLPEHREKNPSQCLDTKGIFIVH